MDDKKYLKDDNLEQLGFINEIDTYEIVSRGFNKKEESNKLLIFILSLSFIVISSISMIIVFKSIDIKGIFTFKKIFKFITLYYFLCTSALMLLTIPILKRKRIKFN